MRTEALAATPGTPTNQLADSNIILLTQPPPRCCVLVVDDDEVVVSHLAMLLRRAGYEVCTAGSGARALDILDTRSCQIVLTDWNMPDMDGIALCRNLPLRARDGYIYVLMLTIRNGSGDILAGLSAGADDYLVKGASAQEILARLEVGRRITHLEQALRSSKRANRRMSVTDALTGARSRRCLMKYLPRELERSRRYQHPLAVLSCDIDHFKRINDGFGHDVGDQILQAFVKRARGCIRQSIDWIARSGGEEFVLVLPETTLSGASCVARRLRDALAVQPIATGSGAFSITVSVGVSALETEQEINTGSAAQLLIVADRCLYASKALGRDRSTASTVDCAEAVLSDAQLGSPRGIG